MKLQLPLLLRTFLIQIQKKKMLHKKKKKLIIEAIVFLRR